MNVLVACEFSGRVRDAFIKRGHNAVSCDLFDSIAPGPHLKGDVSKILHLGWDMLIAFPPCTYLCGSGLHWNVRNPDRAKLTDAALEFVKRLWNAPIPKVAIENPVGCLSTRFMKPSQIIQPYEFGEDKSKKTCLWLRGLPLLKPTKFVPPTHLKNGVLRYANQTGSGQDKTPPSKLRWAIRSLTLQGIADAMAAQWG